MFCASVSGESVLLGISDEGGAVKPRNQEIVVTEYSISLDLIKEHCPEHDRSFVVSMEVNDSIERNL